MIGRMHGDTLKTKSAGYHDMLWQDEIYDGMDGQYLIQFDGSKYRVTKCWRKSDEKGDKTFRQVSCE